MKILFLTNNPIADDLIDWLTESCHEQVIVSSEKVERAFIANLSPDLVISYNYKYIIRAEIIEMLPGRIINLHISYLPWNRGAHPNVWSHLENSPSGVTIHLIDAGIDTGDILFQKRVRINTDTETLSSSYDILHCEIKNLFKENWLQIKNFNFRPLRQPAGGSIHYKKDFDRVAPLLGEKGWNIPLKELKSKYEKGMKIDH